MDTLLSVMIGIGLSAACGFRLFVPFLGIGIAALSGQLQLAPGFEWIGSWPALIAFGLATVLEITAYYVPWFDNLMDTIATPAAMVAGVILSAAMVTTMSPFLKWSLAIIAGGGAAAVVQAGTVSLRGASTAATGGLGNHLVATLEWVGAVLTTLLAIWLPVAGLALALLLGVLMYRRAAARRRASACAPDREPARAGRPPANTPA